MSTKLRISSGALRFVYSDRLRPLLALGPSKIRRASHVEATDDGQWTADMAPVGGPVLGPFERREVALAHEVRWLNTHPLAPQMTTLAVGRPSCADRTQEAA